MIFPCSLVMRNEDVLGFLCVCIHINLLTSISYSVCVFIMFVCFQQIIITGIDQKLASPIQYQPIFISLDLTNGIFWDQL
jgi:hypothetical protein